MEPVSITASLNRHRVRIFDWGRRELAWINQKKKGASIVVVSLLTLFTIILAFRYIAPTSTTDKNEFVRTLAQIIGGGALLFGLYFTFRTVTAAERTVRLTAERELVDRYVKAVELLGSRETNVRLGAIFALERLAQDSERDYDSIIQVLTAFIRTQRPRTFRPNSNDPRRVPEDVQAALTVIGRRLKYFQHGEARRIDLSRSNLAGAHLTGAHLEGADLSYSILTDAMLVAAKCREAWFWGTDLTGATLVAADLRGCSLRRSTLDDAKFFHPPPEQFRMPLGEEEDDVTREMRLLHPTGSHGNEPQPNPLMRLDFLEGADFTAASLNGTDFRHTDLRGVVGLAPDQLNGAFVDDFTKRPNYLGQQF